MMPFRTVTVAPEGVVNDPVAPPSTLKFPDTCVVGAVTVMPAPEIRIDCVGSLFRNPGTYTQSDMLCLRNDAGGEGARLATAFV